LGNLDEKDYYATLGISPSATEEEIKRAYRQQARRYHPDSRTDPTSTVLFHDVQQAYAVLSDPARRQAYDRRRAKSGDAEDAAFKWKIQISQSKFNANHKEQVVYLLIEIRSSDIQKDKHLPLNLCLVIDRSTSMQGARLDHVKQAAYQIIDDLEEDDVLSVVAFDDRAEVILPSRIGVNPVQARAKVAAIRVGGGTEILQGMQLGVAEIEKHHNQRVNSQLILLTDGQTYGDEQGCLAEARSAGARRIGITAMGIGEEWNDVLLEQIASQSNGVSAYIASPRQVQAILQQRVRGLESVFAQGLTLTFRFTEGTRIESLFRTSPYMDRLTWTEDNIVNLGALQIDEPLTLAAELIVSQKPTGEHRLAQLALTGDIPAWGNRREQIAHDVHGVFIDGEPPQEQTPTAILSVLSKVTIYQMQEQAWKTLEQGNVKAATHKLELVATRLFDMGETHLAQAAMLEAGRISQNGDSSSKGRKEVKYGTRSLLNTPLTEKSYD
jgi:Ca-activated chloride channel homolog